MNSAVSQTHFAAPPQSNSALALELKNLSKTYGSLIAVDHLNISVRQGEIFGFLGPNGAGKTTTIRMILGLITPTGGAVELFGKPMLQQKSTVLAKVGALIESPALHTYLSGRDNLRAFGHILGNISEKRIDEILAIVDLQSRAKDRVQTYSLGMKQRLGVAIALLNNPDLLVLDEPANGLDPAGIVEMRDLLRQLSAEGKTVFLSSHVLTEVQQICSRVSIINHGKLIIDATVESLTKGSGKFIVTVENAPAALLSIRKQPWGADALLDEQNRIITQAPQNRGKELIAFMVSAGIVPDMVTQQEENLEEVFLRLTNDSVKAGK